jgi:tetratricopeptide (TPR) repeat protein
VVTGTAGVGKTALAVSWGHRVSDRFADGQLYIDLHGYGPTAPMQPVQALTRFLRALGVPHERVPADETEAASLYRSQLAGRRILVLLDNAGSAEQVRPLLPATSGCVAIVTSRDRLTGLVARDGACRLDLGALESDEAIALLAHALGGTAVTTEPVAARELVRLCGGLPLALRIAAANLTDHRQGLAGYVGQLAGGGRLTALSIEDDANSSIRAAFHHSYAALAPQPRRVFRLLGLVPGPDTTRAATAALAGLGPDVAGRVLDGLAAAHLIEQPVAGRYRFHDLIRLFAVERADDESAPDERDTALGGLYGYYLAGLDTAARQAYPHVVRAPAARGSAETVPGPEFDTEAAAMAWLEAELPNLIAAARHAAEAGSTDVAWRLADGLRGFFWIRRLVPEWLAVTEAGLTAATASGDPQALAAMHLAFGLAYRSIADYPAALPHLDLTVAFSRKAGWPEAEASAVGSLAVVRAETGQTALAIEAIDHALALNRRLGRTAGEAVSLHNRSTLRHQTGDLELSLADANAALARYRALGSQGGEALVLINMGGTYYLLGRFSVALDHVTEGMGLRDPASDPYAHTIGLTTLAQLHCEAGRYPMALGAATSALTLTRETGDRKVQADALIAIAVIYHALGSYDQALEYGTQALTEARAATNRHPEVAALTSLAATYLGTGRFDDALARASEAVAIADGQGFRLLHGQALTTLAAIQLARDEPAAAKTTAGAALGGQQLTGHRLGQARALVVLGRTETRLGDADIGRRLLRRAAAIFAEVGTPEVMELGAATAQHAG